MPARWNGRASRPVYAAGSISLAALERLIYLRFDPAAGMFPEQHLFRIEVPAQVRIESAEIADLPKSWTRMAAPLDPLAPPTPLQKLGDAWWEARRCAAWVVPSALVPEEPNVLLNPIHPDFGALRIDYARPFRYDPRMGAKR